MKRWIREFWRGLTDSELHAEDVPTPAERRPQRRQWDVAA